MRKSNKEIKQLLGKELELYEKFHQKTKVVKFDETDPKEWPESWKTVYFKGYARFPEIKLPLPKLPLVSLKQSLIQRKSIRKFSKKKLDIHTLSSLLHYSAGIKNPVGNQNANRFYPSGGSRYPLEVYIYPLNSNLEHGIYHYYMRNNSLEKLPNVDKDIFLSSFHHEWVKTAGCIIIITAVFKRNTIKYGNRGYRFILSEAGHVSQNIYLCSAALKIGCCEIGGFIENKLDAMLELNTETESVISVLVVGTI